ncbi:hypothetical protein F1737_10850 [Methanoplanus sp. FWC-SCC4]|uniref:Uncharacterized protein n=1 Tax=Methanochimaera problematica TaxID=2609417 RepID=A0AA97FCU1_9EURY|nr:hypothetical protein [Methanoplanus sp. FWC-SCC4]WOF17140.1 hypothetical protein F1737_10850 [Methanoplanus sp. FWC-SCC4]
MKFNGRVGISLLFVVFAVLAVVMTAGCTGSDNTNGATPTETTTVATATPGIDETPVSTEVPGDAVNSFSGTGNDNYTVIDQSNLILAKVKQSTAAEMGLSISSENVTDYVRSSFSDAVADKLKDGELVEWSYVFSAEEGVDSVLEVETAKENKWSIDLTFPEMINGIPPQHFSGIGNMATPFFNINKGDLVFIIKADNNTVIGVEMVGYDGNPVMSEDNKEVLPLRPKEGAYDGSVKITIKESSNYLLNIICDGEWSVDVDYA